MCNIAYYYVSVCVPFQMPVMDGIEATKRFRELELQFFAFSNHNTPTVSSNRSSISASNNSSNNNSNNSNMDDKISVIKRRRLPIIGMSANSDNETQAIAKSVGMDSFMAKPFSISEFEDIVDALDLQQSPDI